MNRVIEHLGLTIRGQSRDEMTDLLAAMVELGELTAGVAKKIRAMHRSMLERNQA